MIGKWKNESVESRAKGGSSLINVLGVNKETVIYTKSALIYSGCQ